MNKYKKGDEVLLRAIIVDIDHTELPYCLDVSPRLNYFWVSENNIVGYASDFTPPLEKFKRGDLVINKFNPAWGVGRIDAYRDDGVYGVQYPSGYMLTNETDLLFARLDELPDETD